MRPAAAVATLAAGVLFGPLLTACGGHRSYCDTVKMHQSEMGSVMHSGSRTGFLQLLPALRDLESSAPEDVRDDYQLLITRSTALQKALDDAGVDISSYDPRDPPAGLTPAERTRIRRAAAQLAEPDAVRALGSVQQEVLDVCHTPLAL